MEASTSDWGQPFQAQNLRDKVHADKYNIRWCSMPACSVKTPSWYYSGEEEFKERRGEVMYHDRYTTSSTSLPAS